MDLTTLEPSFSQRILFNLYIAGAAAIAPLLLIFFFHISLNNSPRGYTIPLVIFILTGTLLSSIFTPPTLTYGDENEKRVIDYSSGGTKIVILVRDIKSIEARKEGIVVTLHTGEIKNLDLKSNPVNLQSSVRTLNSFKDAPLNEGESRTQKVDDWLNS